MGILLSLLVTILVGYLIMKKYKPQPVLIIAGMFLMMVGTSMGYGKILANPKTVTGLMLFDVYEFIRQTLSSRAAALGLNIMMVGGFAKYMDHIGASRALVKLTIKPLLKLKSPYIVLAGCWVVGMCLGLAINSASGLAMLLMVTMFPVLIGLGVSRVSATAAIATTLCLDWSPSDTGTILSAVTAGLDPVNYWVNYQVPIALITIPVVAVLHYFTQKYMDKRDGHVVQPVEVDKMEEKEKTPLYYAILPVIPLALILSFSDLWIKTVKMDIIKAMMIGVSIGMAFEFFHHRDLKKTFADVQVFFDGIGLQMANVVTLIVAGETFARGLVVTGTIDAVIKGAQTSGLGAGGMTFVMIMIIAICSIVMGSGNAPFFAFAALTPTVAAKMSIHPVVMLLPMHFAASAARAISPITAVIVVAAGMANISPFDLVKRTAIPMIGALLCIIIGNYLLFF